MFIFLYFENKRSLFPPKIALLYRIRNNKLTGVLNFRRNLDCSKTNSPWQMTNKQRRGRGVLPNQELPRKRQSLLKKSSRRGLWPFQMMSLLVLWFVIFSFLFFSFLFFSFLFFSFLFFSFLFFSFLSFFLSFSFFFPR